jgi:hypothetical protein
VTKPVHHRWFPRPRGVLVAAAGTGLDVVGFAGAVVAVRVAGALVGTLVEVGAAGAVVLVNAGALVLGALVEIAAPVAVAVLVGVAGRVVGVEVLA